MGILKQKIWTYEDYHNLDDDKRYEVIEGELFEMAAPGTLHQTISSNLGYELIDYVRPRNMGRLLDAPCDVIFSEINTLQPDILFISKENMEIIEGGGIFGSPDLVIEILSPSNADHNKVRKFTIYEKFHVKEYWIIDPEKESVEVFVLEENRLLPYSDTKKTDHIQSKIFADIALCYNDLLE